MRDGMPGARSVTVVALALLVGALALFLPSVSAEEGQAAGGTKAFETPEALVEAWIEAAANNDDAALKVLAGPKHAGCDPVRRGSVGRRRFARVCRKGEGVLDASRQRRRLQDARGRRQPLALPHAASQDGGRMGPRRRGRRGRDAHAPHRLERARTPSRSAGRTRELRRSTTRRTATATACASTRSTFAARPGRRTASIGRQARTANESPFGPLVGRPWPCTSRTARPPIRSAATTGRSSRGRVPARPADTTPTSSTAT